jgi:hypothetical protein
LNERSTDHPGSCRTAAASAPKRNSPAALAAMIDGHASTPSKETTG